MDPASREGLSRGSTSSITLDLRAFVRDRALDSDPDPAEVASVSIAPIFLEGVGVLCDAVGALLPFDPDEGCCSDECAED